jgi:hypothetical protein
MKMLFYFLLLIGNLLSVYGMWISNFHLVATLCCLLNLYYSFWVIKNLGENYE